MNLTLVHFFSVLSFLLPYDVARLNLSDTERIGRIENASTLELICSENTSISHENGETLIRSEYAKDGNYAVKTFSYKGDFQKATYTLYNKLSGNKESIRYNKGLYTVSYLEASGKQEKKVSLKIDGPVCYDEGLVLFAQNNWSKLLAGESIDLAIIVPQRLDYYNFVLELESSDDMFVYATVIPDNFILKQFVKPIKLRFNKSSKALVSLTGLFGINKENSGLTEAVITYKTAI